MQKPLPLSQQGAAQSAPIISEKQQAKGLLNVANDLEMRDSVA